MTHADAFFGCCWGWWLERSNINLSFAGPTAVTNREPTSSLTGALAGNDPMLQMVSILTYALDKSNSRYNNGNVYQFVEGSMSTYISG